MNAVDEFGRPVQRSKSEFPYSYDGFVVYRQGKNREATDTIYSDRMLQQNFKRYNELSLKHFGDVHQLWDRRIFFPEKITAFLSDWCERPVRLIFIMEYCNLASGFPIWRFDFTYHTTQGAEHENQKQQGAPAPSS